MSLEKFKIHQITIITLYVMPLMFVWYYEYLPIQDYPRHLAGIKVLREYYNNSFINDNLSVNLFKGLSPVPNIGFELFASKIFIFFDVNIAGKLFISSYVILFIFSIYLLSGELKLRKEYVLWNSLPLVYSTYFYMGFLNFIMSIPLFLISVWSYMVAKRESKYFMILGLTSILLYLSHLFAFSAFLVFLLIDLIMSAAKPDWKIIIFLIISLSLPVLFSANYILLSAQSPGHYHPEGLYYKTAMVAFPFLFFHFSTGIVMFTLVLYAFYLNIYGSKEINPVFLVTSLSFFFLYMVLPFETIEGQFVDVRAIAFGMAVLPFSVKLESNRYKSVVLTLIFLSSLLNTVVAWSSFSRFDREMSAGLRCLNKVEDKSVLLPIASEDSYGPFGRYFIGEPTIHAWGYAFLIKDIMTPYFSNKVHNILKYDVNLFVPAKGWPEAGEANMEEEILKTYDYMAVYGTIYPAEDVLGRIGEKVCEEGVTALYKLKNN